MKGSNGGDIQQYGWLSLTFCWSKVVRRHKGDILYDSIYMDSWISRLNYTDGNQITICPAEVEIHGKGSTLGNLLVCKGLRF